MVLADTYYSRPALEVGMMHRDDVMVLLELHREELIRRAQDVIDTWDWQDGGACDEIASEIVLALDELEGIGAYAHSQEGGDHTWVVIPVDVDPIDEIKDVIEVDIPWSAYEEKLGGWHRWGPTHRNLDVDDIVFTLLNLDPVLVLDYA